MKYLISLILGIVVGVVVFCAAYYYNPMVGRSSLSPLAVEQSGVSNLSYSATPAGMILITNDGESTIKPHPAKVAELWEPSINQSEIMVTAFTDSRGLPAGVGIKMSTPSTDTDLVKSKILVDSVWHVFLPGRGTFGIYQQEDYFAYIRDVVIPARRNASDAWRGAWSRMMTDGPSAHGTARVIGLSGEFDGVQSEAVETLNARAYSSMQGPISMTGTLSIKMPTQSASAE